jgi:hypothetical protein
MLPEEISNGQSNRFGKKAVSYEPEAVLIKNGGGSPLTNDLSPNSANLSREPLGQILSDTKIGTSVNPQEELTGWIPSINRTNRLSPPPPEPCEAWFSNVLVRKFIKYFHKNISSPTFL